VVLIVKKNKKNKHSTKLGAGYGNEIVTLSKKIALEHVLSGALFKFSQN
jgi:hypothetical protein